MRLLWIVRRALVRRAQARCFSEKRICMPGCKGSTAYGICGRELPQLRCCMDLRLHLMRHENVLKKIMPAALYIRNYAAAQLAVFFPEVFVEGIGKTLKDVRASDWKKAAPHLLYLSFPDTNHAYLATLLDAEGFAVSTGSACSDSVETSLRIGVLPSTTEREVRALVRCLRKQLPIARIL